VSRLGGADERSQTRLLTRTFFSRLFESDLMPAGVPQVRLVTSVIAGIAVPLTIIPALVRLHASRLVAFQYTVSMIAVAFVALVIWEGIFPDARDGRILSPLPIRTRTFVVARLGALAALFGVFAAGSAALPSFVFVLVGNPIAHFIGLVGLDAFAFFSIVALQCVVLNVVGRTTAQRFAIVLQLVIVIVMLQLPLVPANPRRPPDLSAATTMWLPSLWFVGLYEVLAGHATPRALWLGALSAGAAVGLPLATVLLYAATYRRLLRRAIEGEPASAPPRSVVALARAAAKWCLVAAVRNPVARAVCLFTLQTTVRSRRNKMLLAMYVGVGVALVLSVIVPTALHSGLAGFAKPESLLLSLPLVLMFMTLVGMRSVIRIPVEIRANWIFRLAEPARRAAAIGGVGAAMTIAAVLPIVTLAFGSAWLLWGPAVAIRHAAYCAALGLLLTHALLLRLDKVPFTCMYYPGSSRLRLLWPVYLTVFSTYAFTMGRIEASLLERDGPFLAAVSILLAATAALVIARRMLLHRSTGLRFEERDPEALFEGFRFSEMLAAERAHRRATQEH
jgi:hypothetical protein